LADITQEVILFVETFMVGGGAVIAARVARLTGRPPRGWLMLTVSFCTQLVQAVCYLFVLFGPVALQASFHYAGEWLGVPALAFIFIGAYFMYRDFAKQLRAREAEILNPEA
jgi:hypothetical protein